MRNFSGARASLLLLAAVAWGNGAKAASGTIAVPNMFSYQMPAGWAALNLPGATYPSAVEGPATAGPGHLKAMITVNIDAASLPLPEWCSKSLARNQAQFAALHARVGELERFATAANVPGFRANIDLNARGRPIHYVMYFFAGGGDTKLAVTCACAASDADHYAPLFEAAMETFVPY